MTVFIFLLAKESSAKERDAQELDFHLWVCKTEQGQNNVSDKQLDVRYKI